MRIFILSLLVVLFALPLTAQAKCTLDAKDKVVVSVDGMVCDFCAQSISATFKKEKAVEAVEINLDQKTVILNMKAGQNLNNQRIEEIIGKTGYKFNSLERMCDEKA
jgi:copper chaperone CopZ